jgi:uncharacterized membrane protein
MTYLSPFYGTFARGLLILEVTQVTILSMAVTVGTRSMEVLEKTPSTVGMVGTQLIVALMMTLFMVTLEMIVSGAMVAKISSTVVLI